MQHVCAHAGCAPGAPPLDAGEPVLTFEMSQGFLRRHRAGFRKHAHRGSEALRLRRLPTGDHLAHRRAEEPVVPQSDEMQRLPHHRRLDHRPTRELALERLAPEARRARPDADIRRRRPLRLHADEMLDHLCGRQSLPLEQELTRECCAAQLALCENARGHLSTLLRQTGGERRRAASRASSDRPETSTLCPES